MSDGNTCPSCGARYNIWCVGIVQTFICNRLKCGKCGHVWKKERVVIATIMEAGKRATEAKAILVEAIAEQEEEAGEQYVTDLLQRAAKAQQQACDFIEMAAQYTVANVASEDGVKDEQGSGSSAGTTASGGEAG